MKARTLAAALVAGLLGIPAASADTGLDCATQTAAELSGEATAIANDPRCVLKVMERASRAAALIADPEAREAAYLKIQDKALASEREYPMPGHALSAVINAALHPEDAYRASAPLGHIARRNDAAFLAKAAGRLAVEHVGTNYRDPMEVSLMVRAAIIDAGIEQPEDRYLDSYWLDQLVQMLYQDARLDELGTLLDGLPPDNAVATLRRLLDRQPWVTGQLVAVLQHYCNDSQCLAGVASGAERVIPKFLAATASPEVLSGLYRAGAIAGAMLNDDSAAKIKFDKAREAARLVTEPIGRCRLMRGIAIDRAMAVKSRLPDDHPPYAVSDSYASQVLDEAEQLCGAIEDDNRRTEEMNSFRNIRSWIQPEKQP